MARDRCPFEPGASVCGYFRDSGGEAQEASIGQQEAAFLDWCARHGLVPGRVFKDEARRGSSVAGRVAFQDMMHYLRNGATEAGLVIWNYQRFARDIDDSQFFRADIRRRGYIFHSMNDDIPEGAMGRLFEAALDWKNEQFLDDLAADVKRGLHDLVVTHRCVPGPAPRGFRRIPVEVGVHRDGSPRIAHRWEPDPELRSVVLKAFRMRAERKSLTEISQATRLYKSVNCYTTFFANKIYIGVLEFGDNLVIENYCEPIVDRETWDRVQALIKENSNAHNIRSGGLTHPCRRNSRYLLSGLLYCAQCGGAMSGFTITAGGRKTNRHERYGCGTAKRTRGQACHAGTVPRKPLEKAILDDLLENVLTLDAMRERQQAMVHGQSARLAELAAQKREIGQRLAGMRRRIDNVTAAIAETDDTAARRLLNAKLANLSQDELAILSELAEVEKHESMRMEALSDDEMTVICELARSRLTSKDPEVVRAMLVGFIDRIVIERDGNVIRGLISYYFPPNVMSTDEWTQRSASRGHYNYHREIALPVQLYSKHADSLYN